MASNILPVRRTARILAIAIGGALLGGFVGWIVYELARRGFVCNDNLGTFGAPACAGPILLAYLIRGVIVGVIVGLFVGLAVFRRGVAREA